MTTQTTSYELWDQKKWIYEMKPQTKNCGSNNHTVLDQLPPLQLAVDGLLECIINLEIAEQNRQVYDEIISDLTRLGSLLQRHVVESNPQNVPYSMENVARAINEQTEHIKRQQDQSRIRQLALAKEDEEAVLGCYRRVGARFQQLQMDVSLSIWDAIRRQQMETYLNNLLPAHEAYYNAALPTTTTKRVGCTKNTRVEILKTIHDWARGADVPPVFWVNGMAGTGKTTIAYTTCKMLHEQRQLGGSFFCSRNSPDCRNVNKIIPTIAYQLGRYSNPYRKALCDVLSTEPDVAKKDIMTQFEQLILKPLGVMGGAMPDNVVVVIDALDECTYIGGTKDVLSLLIQHASSLPVRFFVTSRPEPAISNRMAAPGGAMRSVVRLHDIEQSLVQADIRTYLVEAMEAIEVTPSEIDQLAARAGRLFIFAATVMRYILPDSDSVDYRERLQTVLELKPTQRSKSYEEIDELYATILSNALHEKGFEPLELTRRRQALHTVICAREPLTIAALAEILGMHNDRVVQLAIHPLQSVLHLSESTSVVSTLHASFPDFLLDKERAGRFHCDEVLQNTFLAECCFRVMEQSLRFNICGLESSYQLDQEVADLQGRIDQAISTGLFYSCRYWGDHITRGSFSDSLLSLLHSFMQHWLLFWLEVLNLKRRLGHGDGVLGQALAWLPAETGSNDLPNFIHDARSFILTLASNPVSRSTPHIYISALPFTSRQSHVRRTYWPKTRGLISVDGAAMQTRGKSVLVTWNVRGRVRSIAQSTNSKFVLSGSEGSMLGKYLSLAPRGRMELWDASRGVYVGTFGTRRHGEPDTTVNSVAFSPDDTRLASGSLDGNIHIWDAGKGDLIAGPLHHHTSSVNSVAFSPNGNFLASGADDQTIRLCDAYTGALLGGPLQGHQGTVQSVTVSPDGKYIASGSSDGTIRIWDAPAGAIVRGPIEGHTDAVYSVAYSPDGLRLASGSGDCSIRVWDMSRGTLLAGPFGGHADTVRSVSFSPDGTRIVSGSCDKSIRVWEAVSGRLLAGPLEGHRGSVNSVLFNADGTRILSGSGDSTIRVWDSRQGITGDTRADVLVVGTRLLSLSQHGLLAASTSADHTVRIWDTLNRTLMAGPFSGHTDSVCSFAFSPDGARIASGSWDQTLRIWDVSTGALLVGPIEGPISSVQSVAFSPNGRLVASGYEGGVIQLWNSHTGESVAGPFEGHTGLVRSISFSPDGLCFVTGFLVPHLFEDDSDDSITPLPDAFPVQMWLASDSIAPLWKSSAHIVSVLCVAFSPDGTQVVSGSDDHTILLLDAQDGAVLYGPFIGHTNTVYSVAFSPDGTRVVSGSVDQTVRIWDVKSGMMLAGPLKGYGGSISCIAFSPDCGRVISGLHSGTIRIWDIAAATRAGATHSDNWDIDNDGWLTDSKSQRLFWVPSDLRHGFGFLTPSNPVVINSSCTTRIDDTILLGDRWHECYVGSADSVSS